LLLFTTFLIQVNLLICEDPKINIISGYDEILRKASQVVPGLDDKVARIFSHLTPFKDNLTSPRSVSLATGGSGYTGTEPYLESGNKKLSRLPTIT
jgi:hypothetical protein